MELVADVFLSLGAVTAFYYCFIIAVYPEGRGVVVVKGYLIVPSGVFINIGVGSNIA